MNWLDFYSGPVSPAFGWGTGIVIVILAIWSLIWKGLALWKSARLGNKVWFVVFLIVNTVGILEILYLYIFSKKSKAPVETAQRM